MEIYGILALLAVLALAGLYISYRLSAMLLRVLRLAATSRKDRTGVLPALPQLPQQSRVTREPTLRLWIASTAKHPAPHIMRAREAARSLVNTLSRPRLASSPTVRGSKPPTLRRTPRPE